jgi:hypothetical protein
MMSSRHGLYGLGYTRATLLLLQRVTIKQLMSISFKNIEFVLIQLKNNRSSDQSLKLEM